MAVTSLSGLPLKDTRKDILCKSPAGSQDSFSQCTQLPEAAPAAWRSVWPLHRSTDWSPLPAAGTFSLQQQHVGTVAPNRRGQIEKRIMKEYLKAHKGCQDMPFLNGSILMTNTSSSTHLLYSNPFSIAIDQQIFVLNLPLISP